MNLTKDAVSGGALYLYQHEEGYRFGLDAILLATDLPPLPPSPVVYDLGAGNGAVGLMIASRDDKVKAWSVEIQLSLHKLALKNIALNNFVGRVSPVNGDIREYKSLFRPHHADLVVCNPPYYRKGTGQKSPNKERTNAHQEVNGTLRDFVAAAAFVAKPNGWLKLIIPPFRLLDLLDAVRATDFGCRTIRFVHAKADKDAYLMECTFRRGAANAFVVRPPLVLHDGPHFTDEVRNRFDHAAGKPA